MGFLGWDFHCDFPDKYSMAEKCTTLIQSSESTSLAMHKQISFFFWIWMNDRSQRTDLREDVAPAQKNLVPAYTAEPGKASRSLTLVMFTITP